ncbi:hypothetical protein A5904_00555 [Acidithiobacillus caldus]|uniref:hypothetical protein n=2 Tax=Acidithiobacillus caldus TaxID=33059 RepID=UPI000CD33B3A|nr:hypothetical protein [Acidithiobacillus caldus]AUW31663.1 hypothetical protein A5904_00555 [Acidithiobacillus caldus]
MDTIVGDNSKQHGSVARISVKAIRPPQEQRRVVDKICHQLECARQDIRNKHYDAAEAAIVRAIVTLLAGEEG